MNRVLDHEFMLMLHDNEVTRDSEHTPCARGAETKNVRHKYTIVCFSKCGQASQEPVTVYSVTCPTSGFQHRRLAAGVPTD
ncbi:unnamed protein product [Gadus morhua 'NCC']